MRMILVNYLIAILVFVVIYLCERLILFWRKKKAIWPLVDFDLLVSAITYTVLSFLIIGILHIVFKKVQTFNLLWLDISLYIFIKLLNPYHVFTVFKNKEKKNILQKHYFLSASLFLIVLLECFAFNHQAYSDNKDVYEYNNFINETITSDGEINEKQILLKNKQYLIINTNKNAYDTIYLHFDNDDMNLYLNIYQKKVDAEDYVFTKYALIDPAINAYGYIKLDDMANTESLKIVFDIDDSRYLDNDHKPTLIVDKLAFDAYFPLVINPLRIGLLFSVILLGANFKKLFIDKDIQEEKTPFRKMEKVILFGGIIIFVYFIAQVFFNSSAYFIKYDDLYLGGTASSNIYYQQFDAYLKGQLFLDVPVDPKLLTLSNPYDPSARAGVTYLWDHAFYNGKYYCYYGHAPIYLVMFPIYLVSRYVPTNLFILQLGTLLSIYTFLLALLQIIKLFIKKTNTVFVTLVLISALFGSLLFTNNTYEYGGMIYRIPYAYANVFLFLTIYLFLKGYFSSNKRFLYFIFAGLSLVFIVLSRPSVILYLVLFIPLIIKMIKEDWSNKKKLLLDYLPFIGIVLMGAVFVCVMNYVRFDSILEFGEHYQLTIADCSKVHVQLDGIIGTIFHYYVQPPEYNAANQLLTYSDYGYGPIDIHSYIVPIVGIFFIPITLLMFIIPYIIKKDDDISLKWFLFVTPFIIFFEAFINYCIAGACPRYLIDIAPFASILGGICALKAIEKDNHQHKIVPSLIAIILIVNIFISGQYHFVSFDGLRIGDFNGLLGMIKTITNQYNV